MSGIGKRRRALAGLVLLAALVVVPLAAGPAAAITAGTIEGTVTSHGKDLQGIEVDVLITTSSGDLASTTTDSNGHFSVEVTPAGSYYIRFAEVGTVTPAGQGYVTRWYPGTDNVADAQKLAITDGSDNTSVNATMTEYGVIKGTVTDAVTHAPVSDADVQAFDPTGAQPRSEPGLTNASGQYTLAEALPGTMVIQIRPQIGHFSPQYYGGEFTAREAKHVSVSDDGTTSGINQTIVGEGHISGSVTDKSTHHGLGSIAVDVMDSGGQLIATTTPQSSGTYTEYAPASTTVHVRFRDTNTTYATQYFNDRPTLSCADPVKVGANATKTGVNAAMTTSASGIGKCPAPIAKAKLKSSLESQLVPKGKPANAVAIHKAGGFSYHFTALEPGAVKIVWRTVSDKTVATGELSYSAKGTRTLTVKLTSVGKSYFGTAGKLHLVADGSFTPKGKSAVTATKVFTLKHK